MPYEGPDLNNSVYHYKWNDIQLQNEFRFFANTTTLPKLHVFLGYLNRRLLPISLDPSATRMNRGLFATVLGLSKPRLGKEFNL